MSQTSTEKSSRSGTHNVRIDLKPDGGYGWIVCCGTFMVNFVVFGIHNSFGVVYVNLLDDLKLGEIQTAWIGAMAMGLNFFFGPITSALCDRFGCRIISFAGAVLSVMGLFLTSFIQDVYVMYLTYGLVWGVGSSLSFVSSIVVLGRYFDRRLALANGIATSGSGVGSLVAGPVINYLLQSVGWKNSMRILSGFANVLWVAALLFKPAKSNFEQLSKKAEEKKKLFDLSIWRNKAYVLWVTTVALFQFGYLVPFVHLVKHAENLGVPTSKGAWLIGFLSITSTLGRLVFGKLADLRFINRLYMYQFSILSIGITTLLLPLANNYAGLVSYALVFGFFDGCFVGQIAVITADVVGHEKMSQAIGNMFGTLAIPMSLGPPFAGWLYQEFGSYDEAFYISGAVAVFSCLLLFGVEYMRRKHSKFYVMDDRGLICNCGQTNNQSSSFECTEESASEAGDSDIEGQPILEPKKAASVKKRCFLHGSTEISGKLLVVERETVL